MSPEKSLLIFIERHTKAEQALLSWYAEALRRPYGRRRRTSKTSTRVRAFFVGRNRVVFNIKGNNDYRLIVAVAYPLGVGYTYSKVPRNAHAQYNRVDAATVEME